jgi:hypothetical protein
LIFDDDVEVSPTRTKKLARSMDVVHVGFVVKTCDLQSYDQYVQSLTLLKKIIVDTQVKLQINTSCNNNVIGRSS